MDVKGFSFNKKSKLKIEPLNGKSNDSIIELKNSCTSHNNSLVGNEETKNMDADSQVKDSELDYVEKIISEDFRA